MMYLLNRLPAALAFVLALMTIIVGNALAQDGGIVPDDNVARWASLVGVFLPLAVAAVTKAEWTSTTKGIATFVLSLAAAFGTSYFAGSIDRGDLVSSFLIVLVLATSTYTFYWKPSGIAPMVQGKVGIT